MGLDSLRCATVEVKTSVTGLLDWTANDNNTIHILHCIVLACTSIDRRSQVHEATNTGKGKTVVCSVNAPASLVRPSLIFLSY